MSVADADGQLAEARRWRTAVFASVSLVGWALFGYATGAWASSAAQFAAVVAIFYFYPFYAHRRAPAAVSAALMVACASTCRDLSLGLGLGMGLLVTFPYYPQLGVVQKRRTLPQFLLSWKLQHVALWVWVWGWSMGRLAPLTALWVVLVCCWQRFWIERIVLRRLRFRSASCLVFHLSGASADAAALALHDLLLCARQDSAVRAELFSAALWPRLYASLSSLMDRSSLSSSFRQMAASSLFLMLCAARNEDTNGVLLGCDAVAAAQQRAQVVLRGGRGTAALGDLFLLD